LSYIPSVVISLIVWQTQFACSLLVS